MQTDEWPPVPILSLANDKGMHPGPQECPGPQERQAEGTPMGPDLSLANGKGSGSGSQENQAEGTPTGPDLSLAIGRGVLPRHPGNTSGRSTGLP